MIANWVLAMPDRFRQALSAWSSEFYPSFFVGTYAHKSGTLVARLAKPFTWKITTGRGKPLLWHEYSTHDSMNYRQDVLRSFGTLAIYPPRISNAIIQFINTIMFCRININKHNAMVA